MKSKKFEKLVKKTVDTIEANFNENDIELKGVFTFCNTSKEENRLQTVSGIINISPKMTERAIIASIETLADQTGESIPAVLAGITARMIFNND